jgi:hypothetical protein
MTTADVNLDRQGIEMKGSQAVFVRGRTGVCVSPGHVMGASRFAGFFADGSRRVCSDPPFRYPSRFGVARPAPPRSASGRGWDAPVHQRGCE